MSVNGWGQGAWNASGWGGFADATVAVTGLASTSALGDESVSADALVSPTGVAGTSASGTVFIFIANVAEPTGVTATGAVGTVVVSIPVSFSVTGVLGTIESLTGWGNGTWGEGVWGGGVNADVGQIITPSSLVGTTNLNTPTVTGDSTTVVTGVAGTTLLESVLVGAGAIATEDSLVGSVGLGDESVVGTCV